MEMKYCCGEVLLSKTNGQITFNCGICDNEFKQLECFLKHALEHLEVSEEKALYLVKNAIAQNLSENYVYEDVESQNYIKPDPDDDGKFEIESLDIEPNIDDVCNSEVNINSGSIEQIALDIKPEELNDIQYNEFSEDDDISVDVIDSDTNVPEQTSSHKKMIMKDKSPEQSSNVDITQATVKTRRSKSIVIDGQHIKPRGPYTCEVCGKKLLQRHKYIRHISIHKDVKPFACDLCGANFADISNLKVHRFRHLGIKPHQCSICNKAFTSSTELKTHSISHTNERPYKCEMCGQSYKASSDLSRHRQSHRQERPHLCNICGKSFNRKRTLRDHLILHSGERPHECPTCSMSFSLRRNLVQHMQLHSDVKKYHCKQCGKAFAQAAGVFSHMKACNRQRQQELLTNRQLSLLND